MDDLTPEVYRALRYRRPLSLLLIDVDHFKRVNDRYGHGFGDLVLVGTAAKLQSTVRASDLVARYGGEEFVVVLPETDLASAGRAAEKLRAAIEAHEFDDGERRARITVSVGVATLTDSRMDPAETARRLIGKADAAMYAAKHAGRNRIRWETDLPEVYPAPPASPPERRRHHGRAGCRAILTYRRQVQGAEPVDVAARVSSRGQVTIPKAVRDALAIEEGDEVIFRVEGHHAVIARTPDSPGARGLRQRPGVEAGHTMGCGASRTRRRARAAHSAVTAFVDSNVLVSHLTGDPPTAGTPCHALPRAQPTLPARRT